jgi:hypothetical protein
MPFMLSKAVILTAFRLFFCMVARVLALSLIIDGFLILMFIG